MSSDILSVLAYQHAQIDHLLTELFRPSGRRASVFIDLASLVAAHVAVETQIFFPRLMAEDSDLRTESIAESLAIKRHVADMLGLEADGRDAEEFDLKLGQLADRFYNHAHAFEDDVLFPLLSELMADSERTELGTEAVALFESLMRFEEPARIAA